MAGARGPPPALWPGRATILSQEMMTVTIKIRGRLCQLRLLGLGAACAAPVLYALWVRPWLLTWGATHDESSGAYPGDELIPDPARSSTMAATLPAPPERLWRWL